MTECKNVSKQKRNSTITGKIISYSLKIILLSSW